jgi:hypothetical protein
MSIQTPSIVHSGSFMRLLSPLDLGPFVLRNRMICTSHNPHYDAGGLIGDQQIAFHRRKAAGGIALSTTGGTTIHASGGLPPAVQRLAADSLALGQGIVPSTEFSRLPGAEHVFQNEVGGWVAGSDGSGQCRPS